MDPWAHSLGSFKLLNATVRDVQFCLCSKAFPSSGSMSVCTLYETYATHQAIHPKFQNKVKIYFLSLLVEEAAHCSNTLFVPITCQLKGC